MQKKGEPRGVAPPGFAPNPSELELEPELDAAEVVLEAGDAIVRARNRRHERTLRVRVHVVVIEDVVQLNPRESRLTAKAEAFTEGQVDIPCARAAEVVPFRQRIRIGAEVRRALYRMHISSGGRYQRCEVEQDVFVRFSRGRVPIGIAVHTRWIERPHADKEPGIA